MNEYMYMTDQPTKHQGTILELLSVESKSRKGETKSGKVQFDLSLDLWLKQVTHQWRGLES